MTLNEAKKCIRLKKIKSVSEWKIFTKSKNFPTNMPNSPQNTYGKKGTWKSWGDFLGTGRKPRSRKS